VRAIDPAGNIDLTPASWSWEVTLGTQTPPSLVWVKDGYDPWGSSWVSVSTAPQALTQMVVRKYGYSGPSWALKALIGDITGDGLNDVVWTGNSAIYAVSATNWSMVTVASGLPYTESIPGVLVDYNGDGVLDIVVGSNGASVMYLQVYNGLGVRLGEYTDAGISGAHVRPLYVTGGKLYVAQDKGWTPPRRVYRFSLPGLTVDWWFGVGGALFWGAEPSLSFCPSLGEFTMNWGTPHNGIVGQGLNDSGSLTTSDGELWLVVLDLNGGVRLGQMLNGVHTDGYMTGRCLKGGGYLVGEGHGPVYYGGVSTIRVFDTSGNPVSTYAMSNNGGGHCLCLRCHRDYCLRTGNGKTGAVESGSTHGLLERDHAPTAEF
jgi:hypothetical protein